MKLPPGGWTTRRTERGRSPPSPTLRGTASSNKKILFGTYPRRTAERRARGTRARLSSTASQKSDGAAQAGIGVSGVARGVALAFGVPVAAAARKLAGVACLAAGVLPARGVVAGGTAWTGAIGEAGARSLLTHDGALLSGGRGGVERVDGELVQVQPELAHAASEEWSQAAQAGWRRRRNARLRPVPHVMSD